MIVEPRLNVENQRTDQHFPPPKARSADRLRIEQSPSIVKEVSRETRTQNQTSQSVECYYNSAALRDAPVYQPTQNEERKPSTYEDHHDSAQHYFRPGLEHRHPSGSDEGR